MLDIYYIEKDSDLFEIPENPDERKWIGSIDLFQYKCLLPLFRICDLNGIGFPYFEDSIMTFDQVCIMKTIFDKNIEVLESGDRNTLGAYKMFMETISNAINLQAGIISFCD